MTTAKAAKAKGSRFENYLREYFGKYIDGYSHRTAGSGSGLEKGDLRLPQHNMVIEAKNQATIHLIKDWRQAVDQTTNEIPVLIIRNPKKAEFKESLVVIDLDTFRDLLTNTGNSESPTVEYSMDYQTRGLIERARQSMGDLLNKLPRV